MLIAARSVLFFSAKYCCHVLFYMNWIVGAKNSFVCMHARVLCIGCSMQGDVDVFVFRLETDVNAATRHGTDDQDEASTLVLSALPAHAYQGLWENLIYEQGLKERLLQYASALLTMSQFGIDSRIISFNKVRAHRSTYCLVACCFCRMPWCRP